MKDKFYQILIVLIDHHARTFELFTFTVIFAVIAALIEAAGLTTATTNTILSFGGSAIMIAIAAGAISDSGAF